MKPTAPKSEFTAHQLQVLAANAEYRSALAALDEATAAHAAAIERCDRALGEIRFLARKDVTV